MRQFKLNVEVPGPHGQPGIEIKVRGTIIEMFAYDHDGDSVMMQLSAGEALKLAEALAEQAAQAGVRRFRVQPVSDGRYTVHDTADEDRVVYTSILTGPEAHAVAHEMVRYFSQHPPRS